MSKAFRNRCRIGTCTKPAFRCANRCLDNAFPRCRWHIKRIRECAQDCGTAFCPDCMRNCLACLRATCLPCLSGRWLCPDCVAPSGEPCCETCGGEVEPVVSDGVHVGNLCPTCDDSDSCLRALLAAKKRKKKSST